MRFFFYFLLGCSFIAEAFAWSPNDVSVLLPLPLFTQMPLLIGPGAQGAKGPLLPRDIYKLFAPLEDDVVPTEIYEKNLKVVGIRLDPCFVEGMSPQPCRRQIRLVWQPLMESTAVPKRPTPFTLDAAFHTFHDFSVAEWDALLKEWQYFSTGGHILESLQVHPGLSRYGYESEYWRRMRGTLLKFCGGRNLTRVAVMTVKTENERRVWDFRTLDIKNSRPQPSPIPGLLSFAQDFSFSLRDLNLDRYHEGRVSSLPGTGMGAELAAFLSSSENYRKNASENDARNLMRALIEFENPRRHNPGTVDCVSCHMAQTIRLWGERSMPVSWWQRDLDVFRFRSPLNLQNNSVNPQFTNRMRAFGYFARDPIVAQRVINETAVVTELLNRARSWGVSITPLPQRKRAPSF